MSDTFKLTIRTPESDIFDGEATAISVNTEGGDMDIFADHASITATITFSPISVKNGNKEDVYMARNGVLLFNNETNSAVILALYCEHKSEVSQQSAKEYLQFIEKQLAEGKGLSDFQILYLKGEKFAV